MGHTEYSNPRETAAVDLALKRGDVQQAFTLLADYLTRNRLTLPDDVFRLYLERELFACLQGRGDIFKNL